MEASPCLPFLFRDMMLCKLQQVEYKDIIEPNDIAMKT